MKLSDRGRTEENSREAFRGVSECRKEFEEMGKFEEVMSKMELKNPSKDIWRLYWASVYNCLERRIGWILLSIGAMIIPFFGGYKMVAGITQAPSTPFR